MFLFWTGGRNTKTAPCLCLFPLHAFKNGTFDIRVHLFARCACCGLQLMRSVYDRHARQLKFSIHQFTYERKSYHGKSYHLYSYCRSCVRLPAACVAASACTWIVQSVNTNCGGEKSPPFSPPYTATGEPFEFIRSIYRTCCALHPSVALLQRL